jgi:hypothetical protein
VVGKDLMEAMAVVLFLLAVEAVRAVQVKMLPAEQ